MWLEHLLFGACLDADARGSLGTAVLGFFSLLDTRNRIAEKDTESFFENIERDIRGNR